MNALRLPAVGIVVCLLGTVARAEEKKADNAKAIVGKWTVSSADEGTVPKGAMVEFMKDGKMKASHKKGDEDFSVDGTYKVDGDKVEMTMKIGDMERKTTIKILKLSDTELSTENEEGKKVTLTKAK